MACNKFNILFVCQVFILEKTEDLSEDVKVPLERERLTILQTVGELDGGTNGRNRVKVTVK